MTQLPRISVALLLALAVGGSAPAWAQVAKCTICHAKTDLKKTLPSGQVVSLYVDEARLGHSAHGNKACTDCHADVQEIPHSKTPEPVDCTRCHFKANQAGAPTDVDYGAYRNSVHGRLAAKGDPRAPTCQSCHGDHQVFGADDPRSKIARANVPETCGTCHLDAYNEYIDSAHGQGVKSGQAPDAAICTDCHGEHDIIEPTDPNSKAYASHVSESCARCHDALPLMSKYGIEVEQVATYAESYHGLANHFGSVTVANCASCHGWHDIRSPDDPKSSVNPAHIAETCGKCHEGTNANYTAGKMHVDAQNPDAGIIYWVAQFFKWLTISTMVALLAHIFLDLNYRAREARKRSHRH